MRLFAVLMALWPVGALAQSVSLGEYEVAETRFGRLQTLRAGDYGQMQLLFRGAPLAEDYRVRILGAFALAGEDHDWAVIETWHGGNMCPFSYVLMKISGQGIAQTEPFGDCQGAPRDVRLLPGAIEVELSDASLLVDAVVYRFDGGRMTRSERAATVALGPMAGAGTDVTRWIGKHPSEVLQDPGEQKRFLQIMTPAKLEELRAHTSVANKTDFVNGWVFGRGCMPHACNVSAGGWGIRVADGAAVAMWGKTDWGIDNVAGHRDALADPAVQSYFSMWLY